MRLEAFYMYPVTNIKNNQTSSDLSADKGYIDIKEIKFSDCNLLMEWEPKAGDVSINEKSKFLNSRDNKKLKSLNTTYTSQFLISGKSLDKIQVIEYNNKIYHKCFSYNYIVNEVDDTENIFLSPIKKENIQKYILKTNSLFCKKYIEKAFLEDLKDINNINYFSLNTLNQREFKTEKYTKNKILESNTKKFILLKNIYQYLINNHYYSHIRSKKDIKLFDIYNGFSVSEIPKALARHKRRDSYTLSKYNESLNILNELENEFIIIDNELWCEGKMPVCIHDKIFIPENFFKNYQVIIRYNQQNNYNFTLETTDQNNLGNKTEQKTRFTYYNKKIIDNLYDKKQEETLELRKNIIQILFLIFNSEQGGKLTEERTFKDKILEKENNKFLQIIANIILYLNNNQEEELLKNIQEFKKYNPTKLISSIIKKCENLELNKDIIFDNNIKI